LVASSVDNQLSIDELIAIKWAYWKKIYWHNRNTTERQQYAMRGLQMTERITIDWCNERWMNEYSWIIWSCYAQLNSIMIKMKTDRQLILTQMSNRYHKIFDECQLHMCINHPIRMRFLRDYTVLCNYLGTVVDDSTMLNLVQMIADVRREGQGAMTSEQYEMSVYWRAMIDEIVDELRSKRYIF
jgi:hypothetical protein